MLTDAGVAITTAFITKSAISLAYGLIFSALLELILSFLLFKLRPRFRFDKLKAKTIIHQGKWMTSAGVFSYFSQKTPDIIIGRTMNSVNLGYFQMAYRLAILPFEETLEMFNRVAFPVYTKIVGDRARLARAMKQYYLALLALCLPILGLMLIFATPIVKLVLGETWMPIVPTLRILSMAGIVLVLNGAIDPLLLATKNQRFLSHVNLVRVISVVILAIPLTLWGGIEGAALAFFISLLITLPVRFYYGFRALANVPVIPTPNS
jgi:PST family polysaccharide transporter